MPIKRYRIKNVDSKTFARGKGKSRRPVVVSNKLCLLLKPGEDTDYTGEDAELAMMHLRRIAKGMHIELEITELKDVAAQGKEAPWVIILKEDALEHAPKTLLNLNDKNEPTGTIRLIGAGKTFTAKPGEPCEASEFAAHAIQKAFGYLIEEILPRSEYLKRLAKASTEEEEKEKKESIEEESTEEEIATEETTEDSTEE